MDAFDQESLKSLNITKESITRVPIIILTKYREYKENPLFTFNKNATKKSENKDMKIVTSIPKNLLSFKITQILFCYRQIS